MVICLFLIIEEYSMQVWSFEISGITQLLTHHVPEDLNPGWHCCENLVFWYDCQREKNLKGFGYI